MTSCLTSFTGAVPTGARLFSFIKNGEGFPHNKRPAAMLETGDVYPAGAGTLSCEWAIVAGNVVTLAAIRKIFDFDRDSLEAARFCALQRGHTGAARLLEDAGPLTASSRFRVCVFDIMSTGMSLQSAPDKILNDMAALSFCGGWPLHDASCPASSKKHRRGSCRSMTFLSPTRKNRW